MKLTDLRGILHYVPQFRERTFILALDAGIIGGMTVGTLFTLFVIPVAYTYIMGERRLEIDETAVGASGGAHAVPSRAPAQRLN